MSGKGIEIGVASETKAFKQGVDSGIIAPLEDAADKLDDLGKSKGPDKLEAGMKDAQKASEKLGKEVKSTADQIEREFRDSYKSVAKSSDDGMRAATEGVQDFKQEAEQSAKETAASFDGSFESIVGMAQEVSANALSGFGPAGAVAGLAMAAGIGLAVKGFEDVTEAQKVTEVAAAEWADKFIESGQRVATAAQQTGSMVAIATDPEKYKEATEAAEAWGVDVSTAMLAMSGNAPALKVVNDSVDLLGANAEKAKVAALGMSTEMGGTGIAVLPVVRQFDDASARLDVLNGSMDEGARRARIVSDSYLELVNSAEGATEQVDELGNKVVTLPDNTQIFIDAQTKQASQNVDQFKGDLDTVPAAKRVVVEVDDSAWEAWKRKPRQFTAGVTVRGKEWQ